MEENQVGPFEPVNELFPFNPKIHEIGTLSFSSRALSRDDGVV